MTSPPIDRGIKSRPYWLLLALVPVGPALISNVKAYLQSRNQQGHADWGQIAFSFFDWLVVGLLTPLIYVLARHFPVRRKGIGRAIAGHLFGVFAFALVWTAFGLLLSWLLHRFPRGGNILHGYLTWLEITLSWSAFVYLLMLGCMCAFTYYREARERESQEARLATQLTEARLSALRMQLNPHFLFNSLNAITVLVRDQKTREASEMLELLNDVLHQVLQGRERREVTLDEELSFIEKYLAIEQVRFSDRLRVQWSIEPTVRDTLVPEFILQPLVENAIRHGVAQLIEAGVIEIRAEESDGELMLSVRDNGPGYRPTTDRGLGISNTRERLATLYRDAGQLRIMAAEGGGTIAMIRIAMKKKGDE